MTGSTLEIRSFHDRLAIEVAELTHEGTIFRCTLEKGAFRGEVVANTYLVGPPSILFAAIAREWRGWNGAKTWQDRDYALTLKAHCNSGGAVTLHVEMRLDQPPELTTLTSSLYLESAYLDRIAREAADLFQEDRSLQFLSSLGRRN
ncbi:MAG TPA: DUF6228 family protein [Hyphomicrobiaceae bacterium]|nr:DUF6228 family protein [Hyphomicrobiaceae bacterium]